jgi:hypothetical protein
MDKWFLIYDDPLADRNFKKAKQKLDTLSEIVTGTGIHDSHRACALKSLTDRFLVLDADCEILDDFNYTTFLEHLTSEKKVFVYRAINPVNNLVYGHGGIKVFDRRLFNNNNAVDMTTAFDIVPVDYITNIHKFNSTAYHTWRTAFRECVKLASGTVKLRNKKDDEYRLTTWCEVFNDVDFAEFAKQGALAGREYGYKNEELSNINNFKWLKSKFKDIVK